MPITITAYVPSVTAGAYPAVCTLVEDKANKADGSIFRVWEFTLADGTGRTVGASSSIQTTPRSKGGKWIAALLGRTPNVGEDVDVIGRPCIVGVEINDDGYEKVTTVMPPMAAPVVAPRPAAELAEATEKAAKIHAAQEGDELPF